MTLKSQEILSKKTACEELMFFFPSQYESILTDAINYRLGIDGRKSWIQKGETRKFLDYCIQEFNELYKVKYGE